ncbi:PAS domain-containing protein [Methylobacterium sp. A54F]
MMSPSDTAQTLRFSSREFMRLIETLGLSGTWGWTFATGEQQWSPGLYRLLGLEAGTVRPDYELILGLVHPEDRPSMASAAEIVQAGLIRDQVFRLLRPDGTQRTLRSRGEIFFGPDGRPTGASGVLIDVSDREQLARLQRAESQRRRALAEQAQVFVYTERTGPFTEYGPEFLALTGLRREDLQADWAAPIAPEEQAQWREAMPGFYGAGKPFRVTPTLVLADGGRRAFSFTAVPLRGADGAIESWTLVIVPAEMDVPEATGDVLRGMEQAIEGAHLRAGRALLDWTLADFAQASGLSVSTIRRLEEGAEGPAARSRHVAVAALREAGIGFSLVEGNVIAVAKLG